MNDVRKKLQKLYGLKEKINVKIQRLSNELIKHKEPPYIYITDHAIARYIERGKGFKRLKNETDSELIERYGVAPQHLRREMLDDNDHRTIINKQIRFYRKKNVVYIIIALTLVTVKEQPRLNINI